MVVRQRLIEERRRTADRLAQLRGDYSDMVEATRDSNADDEHDPEGHTIAYERAHVDVLVRQAAERVAEIDAALARWAQGRYGMCERCGASIPAARLEARPTTRNCIGCAER